MFSSKPDDSTHAIAIDPGTAQTRMYASDAGLIFNEPSLGATLGDPSAKSDDVLAWGNDAIELVASDPDRYDLVRAVQQGSPGDRTRVATMLRYFLRKARRSGLIAQKFHVMLALPSTFAGADTDRLINTCRVSGAAQILIADRAAASTAGALINRRDFDNPVMLDLGASGVEMCGYSAGEMVFHRQLIQGGDIIDLALQSGLRDEFDMQIHAAAARDLKHRIGAALIDDEHAPAHTSCQVVGRDVVSGRIRNFRIGADTVHQMMQPVLAELLQATLDACDCLPAALADSLHRNGLRLVGGGAALTHLQALITEYTGLPISIADRPLTATVRGAATMLDQAIDTRRQAGSDLQKMVG